MSLPILIKAWNRILGREQNVVATGGALHTLQEWNAAVHHGYSYHYGTRFALPPGAVAFFAATPNSFNLHWEGLNVDALTGPIEIDFYKNTVVASGTQVLPTNRNLEISSSSSTYVQQVATLTNTGDSVAPTANLASPTLGGRDIPSGNSGVFKGFILPTSGTFSVGMKNTSADSATMWVNFLFSEPRYL